MNANAKKDLKLIENLALVKKALRILNDAELRVFMRAITRDKFCYRVELGRCDTGFAKVDHLLEQSECFDDYMLLNYPDLRK